MAPTSSKQHGVNVSVNASATPFQQPSGYGSHGYNTGKFPWLLALWPVWDITGWEKDLVFESGLVRVSKHCLKNTTNKELVLGHVSTHIHSGNVQRACVG